MTNNALVVRDSEDQHGLFCEGIFPKDSIVMSYGLDSIQNFPTRTSVQVGVDQHIEVGETLAFMNHSSNPTCKLRVRYNALEVVPRRKLVPGDQITFNYNTTEYDMAEPFVDWETGEQVSGWKHLSEEQKDQLRDLALEYLYESETAS